MATLNYLASDVIYAAYRLIGALRGPQRVLSSSEMQDGLDALNALVDSWNINPLTIWSNQVQIFNLIVNQQVYTIGKDPTGILTANFDVPRPDKITNANIITQIGGGQPVRVPLTKLTTDGWAAIQVQATGSSIPQAYYDDYGYPLSNIYFWPFPNAAAQFEMYSWQTIGQFSTPGDNFLCPPGYLKAIQFNLAVDLHPRYPQFAMDPSVVEQAMRSLAWVEAHNSVIPVMSCDPALLSRELSNWSYLTGDYATSTGQGR